MPRPDIEPRPRLVADIFQGSARCTGGNLGSDPESEVRVYQGAKAGADKREKRFRKALRGVTEKALGSSLNEQG